MDRLVSGAITRAGYSLDCLVAGEREDRPTATLLLAPGNMTAAHHQLLGGF